jgi:hypothetical protein
VTGAHLLWSHRLRQMLIPALSSRDLARSIRLAASCRTGVLVSCEIVLSIAKARACLSGVRCYYVPPLEGGVGEGL